LATKDRLKSRILRLLKEDEEFRYAVAGLLGLEEILKRLDRNEQELVRLREDMTKGFERHDVEIAKLREDMIKGFERHDRELARLREDMMRGFDLVNRHISAIGARWGIMAEDAFREGLRGILEKEFGVKVERWVTRDDDGIVYGFSSVIEIDIAIKDGKTMLIEISSSVDERHDREIQRLTEEMNRLREDMVKGFELVNRHISAIGARWGIMAEDAFREGLRGILEKEFGVKVERWVTRDEDGIVYGFSSVIEIDIAIKDGKTMLIEISSSVDKSKVAAFLRKSKLYEKKTGIKPDRLIMVTPYADEDAIAAAKEVNVEIYTKI